MGKRHTAKERTDSLTHAGLIKLAVDGLNAMGCYAWKNQSGAYKRAGAWIKYGLPGSSDVIVVVPGGFVVFVEAKIGSDEWREDQRAFATEVKTRGCVYQIITSADDLEILKREIRGWRSKQKRSACGCRVGNERNRKLTSA